MTSLRVLQYLAPHAYGGIESIVRSLTLGLSERGAQVTVAAMVPDGGPGGDWVRQLRKSGAAVEVLEPSWNLGRDAGLLSTLAQRVRPDLIHCHGYRADIVAALAGDRRCRIATVHGFNPVDTRSAIYGHLDRFALRRYTRVLAVSPVIRDRLVRSGVRRDRIAVVLNGIDVATSGVARDALRGELGVPATALVIGTVGRLSAEKGHRDLVEALAQLPRDGSWKLVVVGDGPERARIEAAAATLGVTGHVQILGARTDLERLYPCFDIFVLPSHTEGSPTALIEAYAYGLPVLATRVGAVPEMLLDGRDGLIVPPREPLRLGQALLRLLNDGTLRRALAQAGSYRYQQEFTRGLWLDRIELEYACALAFEAPS